MVSQEAVLLSMLALAVPAFSQTNPVPERDPGGIECAVLPTKASFGAGERLGLGLIYRNVSHRPLVVYAKPDPFWHWMRLETLASSGQAISRSPIVDGVRLPLSIADFVTLQPGATTSVELVTDDIRLDPGEHHVQVRIKGAFEVIPGFKEFCKEHGLSPWTTPTVCKMGTILVEDSKPASNGQQVPEFKVIGPRGTVMVSTSAIQEESTPKKQPPSVSAGPRKKKPAKKK